jgi:hypothetical protein
MAGDWIKWVKGLTRKHEIMQIAARLHMRPQDAAGTFMELMEWVDDNVAKYDAHGNAHVTLGPLQSSSLDVTLGVGGFMEAMAEAGWILVKDDDLIFKNAERHNGQTAKARALTRNRVLRFRGNGKVTKKTLPEKRREEKSKRVVGALADDSTFLETIRRNPAYQGIDIDRERGKAESWCLANRRVCSRRFFVNWLNKCERPLGATGQPKREIPPEPVNWRGILGDHFPDSAYLDETRDWAHIPEGTRQSILDALQKVSA